MPPYETKAQEFLKIAEQFQLGDLVTESPHPFTIGLSQMVNLNMDEAIKSFVKVDKQMLEVLVSKSDEVFQLSKRIKDCFDRGGRLFLSGCGATGRLSLVVENLWRQTCYKLATFGLLIPRSNSLTIDLFQHSCKMHIPIEQPSHLGIILDPH